MTTNHPLRSSFTALVPEQLLAAQQQVLDLVAGGAPIVDTLNAISQFSEKSIPTMMASVLLFDPVSKTLRKGGYGCLPSTFADAVDGLVPGPATGSCGTAAYRRERIISREVATDPLWAPFKDFAASYGIASAWSTPILSADKRLLGVFGMYYGDLRVPTSDDLKLVDHFVHLAAIAIDRHRVDSDRDFQATHDGLTGLGNRRLLEVSVANWVAAPTAHGLSVVLIDLDRFKMHNEILGHRRADKLLQAAAVRIGKSVGDSTLVVRLGGNQFVMISGAGPAEVRALLDQLTADFKHPFQIGDTHHRLSFSAGIVEWNPGATAFDDALYQAEQACTAAKSLGRERWVSFGENELRLSAERRQVARVLTQAIVEQRIEPYLQPIMSLANDQPVGFEALARLVGTDASAIPPNVFIPIAEESSLIDSIGTTMFRSVCKLIRDNAALLQGLTVSVNVSLQQLMRDGFITAVTDAVTEFGIQPAQICFEVTESVWLESDSPATVALISLKSAGFCLALDDFGTGYASLNQLRMVPFDHVKIDKSFVHRLGDGERGNALCEAAVRMASACGMPVTAEGVETQLQADMLRAMGCQQGQGYFWSRPKQAAEAFKWLNSQRRVAVG